jgi:monovalent cation:H+ antiporter-2, CPA2 family
VLLTQDIAVIPMLALIPLLAVPELMGVAGQGVDSAESNADHGSGLSLVAGLSGWQTALVTLGAIGIVVLGGSLLTTPIFRFIAAARLRELFTAAALMIVISIALLMTLVGLSPALGTFLAGVVLANSVYRHELESDIDPFKGLLLGLFFMTVGVSVDFALLFNDLAAIVALTLGLMVLKTLVMLLLGRIFSVRGADNWLFALGLAQAGEFGFVLLSFTVANGVVPAPLADRMLLVVALSMLLTPALFILYDRIVAPRYSSEQEREADKLPGDGRIIIAGAGRVGGLVDRILRAGGFDTTVIDFSSKRLAAMERFGMRHYFGDATRPDLLHAAGIAEARLLIVAIDDREQISELVQYAMRSYPEVHVITRAVDRDHVYDLYAYGCRDIIRETYDSTLRMGRSAFEALGVSRETARRMIEIFNESDREAMMAVADVHISGVLPQENEAYIAKVREVLEVWEPALQTRMEAIRAADP